METIDAPCAEHDLLSAMSPAAPATAIAVAEQVPVHDCRSAAVVPFPAARKADARPSVSSAPLMPPAGSVPDYLRTVIEDVLRKAARTKNVLLPPDDVPATAVAMLDALPLADRYQLAAGNPGAIDTVGALINTRLDDVAVQHLLRLIAPNEATEADLVTAATAIIKQAAEARQEKGTMVWPDAAEAVAAYYRTRAQTPQANDSVATSSDAPPANRRARRAAKKSRKARGGQS